MTHVIHPITLICFTDLVGELAIALGVAEIPVSFKRGAIIEAHKSFTVAEAVEPLALVTRSCFHVSISFVLKHILYFTLVFFVEELVVNFTIIQGFYLV